jgi:hypothetical protein
MHSRRLSAFGVVVFLCLLPMTGVSQTPAGVPGPDQEKNILYTGQLDGFLGTQKLCNGLTVVQCQTYIAQRAASLNDLKLSYRSILVGMGDNFGPDLLWNPCKPGACPGGLEYPPSYQYLPANMISQRTAPKPGQNHVVQLMGKSYDAVVPGKEDFVYGVKYLHAIAEDAGVPLIANNLVVQPTPSPECLSYPAATPALPLFPNQVSTAIASGSSGAAGGGGGGGSAAAGTCPTQPAGPSSTLLPTLAWPDSSSIYPWTISIAVSVPTDRFDLGKDALICPIDPKSTKKDDIPPTCIPWTAEKAFLNTSAAQAEDAQDKRIAAQTKSSPPPLSPATTVVRYTLKDAKSIPVTPNGVISEAPGSPTAILFPENSVKLCLYSVKDHNYECTDSSSPITVQRTLFPRAWITATNSSGEDYVVFAALAPDTLNGLSTANRQWSSKLQTPPQKIGPPMQVATGDPAQAVTQAVNAFNQLNSSKKATAVVLAQMTPAEAKSLSDSLGVTSYAYIENDSTQISVILSAADVVESTPQLTLSTKGRVPATQGRYIPVVTPGPIFQKEDCLGDSPDSIQSCVARLGLTHDDSSFTNTPAMKEYSKLQSTTLSSSNTFCDDQPHPPWECKMLEEMRESLYDSSHAMHADIAILEAKDFDYQRSGITPDSFVPPASPTSPTSEQVIKALWNAGNLTRVTLLGSTLTTILTQNQTNQARTYQTLATVRQAEQLRIVGIYHRDKTFYVRGVPLDQTKLYSVATSDNLANTTSDYSSLSSPDQNFPDVFWHHGHTVNIADIANVATGLPGVPRTTSLWDVSSLEAPYQGQVNKADRAAAAPQIAPITLTHSNRSLFSKPDPAPKGGKPGPSLPTLSSMAQFEPFTHIVLQQVAVGYSFSKPSQSDENIGANLGGVSNPNVATAHSDTFSSVADGRIEHYLKRGPCRTCFSDFGIDGQFNFTHTLLGSTTPSTAVTTAGDPVSSTASSFPANAFFESPFFDFQTSANKYWKPLVLRPGVFSVNVASATQFLASAPPATPPASGTPSLDFELTTKRTETVGANVGTRLEKSDFNYVELGYSWQKVHDVLSGISAPGQMACSLANSMTLADCAKTLNPTGPLTASYSTYTQNAGGYLMGMLTYHFLKQPFPKGYPVNFPRKTLFLYQGTAFGNFFAYERSAPSSLLTRYAFQWNNSLQFTLPANFTFGPSYNLFFYQANQHGIGSSLHRSALSVQLNYSFDWHSGASSANAAVGKVQ